MNNYKHLIIAVHDRESQRTFTRQNLRREAFNIGL